MIEGCVVVSKCDVCEQTKEVRYCKLCHAYICQDCRHNYPERVNAMLRRRFSQLGKKTPGEGEFDSIAKELSSPAAQRQPDGNCGGCY